MILFEELWQYIRKENVPNSCSEMEGQLLLWLWLATKKIRAELNEKIGNGPKPLSLETLRTS